MLVNLLRGVVYREQSAERWRDLIGLQAAARDYVRVLGLELIIDDAEGYAFLRQFDADGAGDGRGAERAGGTEEGSDTAGAGGTSGASGTAGIGGAVFAASTETETLPRLIARRQLSYLVSLLL
ncbi:MAG: DUF4194 domain-containing protein, partial [Betaproteobacteria bacterium]